MPDPFTTGMIADIVGDEDLTAGTCAGHDDPTIWTGDWVSQAGQGAAAVKIRQDARARAVALCHTCPVLEACERQLQAFEAVRRPVFGIMAGRRYRQPRLPPGRPAGSHPTECLGCGRHMHTRPWKKPRPEIPDGDVFHRAKNLCDRCHRARCRNNHPVPPRKGQP